MFRLSRRDVVGTSFSASACPEKRLHHHGRDHAHEQIHGAMRDAFPYPQGAINRAPTHLLILPHSFVNWHYGALHFATLIAVKQPQRQPEDEMADDVLEK